MNWKEKAFRDFKLYAVTDFSGERDSDLSKIDAAYRGGADIVQLRAKLISDGAFLRLAVKIRKISQKYRKLFL